VSDPVAPVPTQSAAPEERAPRDPLLGKVIVRVILALAVGVSVFAVKAFLFGDKATEAQIGDCIDTSGATAATTETRAKIVDCSSAAADFTVAGRVDGETNTETTACDRFFADGEEFIIYSSTGGGGYLLCLRPKS
jgi:hypothetical protein